jgi:hypothetical protein
VTDLKPWRPYVDVRVIAGYQIIAALVLAGMIVAMFIKGTPVPWQYGVLASAIVVAAVYGGVGASSVRRFSYGCRPRERRPWGGTFGRCSRYT